MRVTRKYKSQEDKIMGLKQFEAEILAELREVAGCKSIRQKDIMEWSTGTIQAHEGEKTFHLPKMCVNVAVLVSALPKDK
jgi:hypothetical protein